MTDVLRLMDYVQRQGDAGRERGEQSRLGQLSGQLYTGTAEQRPETLGAIAKLNPQLASQQQSQFQSQDDRVKVKARGAAKYMLDAYNTKDANRIQGAYNAVRPFLEEIGRPQGKVPPPAFSDDMLPGLYQLVAENQGTTGTDSVVHSQKILANGNIANTMRDGTIVDTGMKADRQAWFRDHPGMDPEIVGKDGSRTTLGGPTQQPAPQAPQAGMYQTPQGIVRIGDDLSPEDREAAMVDMAGGGTGAPVTLPPRAAPVQQSGGGARKSEAQIAAEVEAAKLAAQNANFNTQLAQETATTGMKTAAEIEAARQKAAVEAEAKAQAEANAAATTRSRDATKITDLLDEAERLLPNATGSQAGATADRVMGVFGKSTAGAQATAALKTIAGQLTASQPKMSGPQSDKDVEMYRQMAGDLANDTLPVQTRIAAAKQIRRLHQKYANGGSGAAERRAVNRQTGQVVVFRNGQWVPE